MVTPSRPAFLTEDVGLAGPVAYAYLSAGSDFQCSQVVDRTTGIHVLITKAEFEGPAGPASGS